MSEKEYFSDHSCNSLSFCILNSKANRPQSQKYILNIARLVKIENIEKQPRGLLRDAREEKQKRIQHNRIKREKLISDRIVRIKIQN